MPQENSNLKEHSRLDIHEPKKFAVIFHNDDFTPMDFVVIVLISIFSHDVNSAESLMLKVHNEGQAVVGVYSYDIACSKIEKTKSIARENGFPLRLSCREV